MLYSSFLAITSQLAERRKASVIIEDQILNVERKGETNAWIFSLKIGQMSKEVLSCFSSKGTFYFQPGDVLIEHDPSTDSIYAVHQVTLPFKKYIPFKQYLTYFLGVASDYQKLFIH